MFCGSCVTRPRSIYSLRFCNPLRLKFNDDQALYEQEQKETIDLTETLVKQYGVENINSNMLEGLGYTPEQIGKILKEIC